MGNFSFPFFDSEMVNSFFHGEKVNSFFGGEMGKDGRVTEIFSRSKTFIVSNSFFLI